MRFSSARSLSLLVVFMFAFGFMLVPLYSVFCEITGLNGKTSGQYQGEVTTQVADDARIITVQFVANRNASLPWQFAAQQEVIKVALGETKTTSFHVVNTYDTAVIAQAIPSVSPSKAAPYLHKIECFCFQQQVLASGEGKHLSLVFFIDESLPEEISKLTLSYTLFDISDSAEIDI